ncbi:hypothetical protein TPHA_0G01510 [Tetrapisispora phaffii CBS 4417]|uniref:Uncharacterized protein n=1 Tax=Tetrapisispora phaffii (strain ATCC 24235 / CBS 4417 / NBRC 1672 / NRRL Y-8282 / UCD 70-5) TaxID=1071381 RepID=G8BVQ9_TETPH|nr:hypothetical protein TPHA_0G01510 [Tetrapisispora phaffii CBS 4417]CCE63987.1 hypothetical protein TPHA_0G01510 [Tetrapisispora phaffii CBS 4417]
MSVVRSLTLLETNKYLFKYAITRGYSSSLHSNIEANLETSHVWKNLELDHSYTKQEKVEVFKKYLNHLITNDLYPESGSKEDDLLREIFQTVYKKPMKRRLKLQQLKYMYKGLLDNKINRTDLSNLLDYAYKLEIINVSVPKIIKDNALKSNLQIKSIINNALKMEPKNKNSLDNVIDGLQADSKINKIPARHIKLYLSKEKQKKDIGMNNAIDDADIQSIGGYLEKEGIKQKEIKKLAWEQNKKYNWQINQSPKLESAAAMLFKKSNDKYKLNILSYIKIGCLNPRYDLSIPLSNMLVENSNAKEILVYDLSNESVILKTNTIAHNEIISNVEIKDLFDILNQPNLSPEDTLVVLNKIMVNDWELIGINNSNRSQIIFQRPLCR